MKVNLLIGGKDRVLGTHLNLDCGIREKPEDPDDIRVPGTLDKWDGVSPNEVTEILAYGILDRLPPDAVYPVFQYWVSRLAVGGSLIFSAVDVLEVCSRVVNSGDIVSMANDLLYSGRTSAHTVWSLKELAERNGLKVVWSWFNGVEAVVEAKRE